MIELVILTKVDMSLNKETKPKHKNSLQKCIYSPRYEQNLKRILIGLN